MKILICFDNSAGAKDAIEAAGRLFPGADTLVVHAWQRPLSQMTGYGYGQFAIPSEVLADVEQHASHSAQEIAEGGAALAARVGLAAEARAYEANGALWPALLAAAEDATADVIVAGSRGFGEVRSLLLGSTSQALAHHSRLPLLIVPPSDAE
jgi:nucleotide-binding universal stress UspA family protein